MSNYLQKYHLKKVQPLKNRTRQTPQDFFKLRQKSQKSSTVKIPLKNLPPHKPFYKHQDYQSSPSSPLITHKTQQLIRFTHQLSSQPSYKDNKRHLDEKMSSRSHKSLNFKSGKDSSAGIKIITTIQDFFNKIMQSNEGCGCGQPCPYSILFFKWADVPYQIVKDHYFKVLNRWYQALKQDSKTLTRTNSSNQLSRRSSRMTDYYQQARKNRIQINKDIDRTQSESSTFQNNVFKERQYQILMSYAFEDKQVGYIQGMNMILSGLLYHIKEEVKTYAVFRKLIFTMRSIYLNNFSECYEHIRQIKLYLKTHVNDLSSFLQSMTADLNIICLPWILSLLTSIIPLNYLHLIYQGFIQDKWIFFYRVCLAIFIYHKQRIMSLDDAAEILLIFSPTNQERHEYDWQDIILYSKSIKL